MLAELFTATALIRGLHLGLLALCFRALPFVAYVLVGPAVRIPGRVVVSLGFAGLVAFVRPWDATYGGLLAAAYAFFLVAGCCVPFLARCLREDRVTLGAAFALSAGAFFILPLMLFPLRPPRLLVLVVGWDLMLAAYSYSADMARSGERSSLSDCLFFLFVNPVLVYAERGTKVRGPGLGWNALGRLALGFVTIAAASWLAPSTSLVDASIAASTDAATSLLLSLAAGAFHFFVAYGQMSGMASLQIGLMRSLGHDVPERFDWPILARDPLEFWRRWNTYVTGWLLRYVFWPLALRYRRTPGPAWRRVLQGLSVLATFAAAGVLHDAYTYALGFDFTTHSSRAFVLSGLVVLLWLACRGLWIRTSRDAAEPGWLGLIRAPALVLLWLPILSFFSP